MRHTKSQRGNTRSHHALVAATLSLCAKCGQAKLPHAICGNCGYYKGKEVVNVAIKSAKKAAKNKAAQK
jgi:large subunit ribosomal protein L32